MKLNSFINLVASIKEKEKQMQRLNRIIGGFNSSHTVLEDKPFNTMIKNLIIDEFGEQEWDTFSWWFWDLSEKCVYRDKKKIEIKTPKDLYKFLRGE